MSSVKTIQLKTTFEIHGKLITAVEVHEPTGNAYVDFGEPFVFARNLDGAIFSVEQPDVIKRYVEKCVKAADTGDVWGELVLKLLCLADAKKVKRTLLGFFTDAEEESFSTKPTPLPSDGKPSASTPPSA
jgi:hypothetical protein